MAKKSAGLEISSSQLTDQLIEVKERLSAIETIISLGNRKEVHGYVAETLKTAHSKKLLAFCSQPRTKAQLRELMGLNNVQALDHHLKALRSDNLVEQQTNNEGRITFEWSNLFKRLPVKDRDALLASQKVSAKKLDAKV